MDKKQQPEALRLAEMLTADEWPGNVTLVSYARECVAELLRLHAYCQELESQVIRDCMTHAQNPTENEHVAGDVSKNGVELNMGTVPAYDQQVAAYAELPPRYYLAGGVEKTWDQHQMHAFADATCVLRASRGQAPADPSPTAGMNIPQRILHVGGRNNDAGYVEFGSIQAVEALVRQVLRDLPAPAPADSVQEDAARLDWLLLHISGAEFRRIGVHCSGNTCRADVDAARKQGENHD